MTKVLVLLVLAALSGLAVDVLIRHYPRARSGGLLPQHIWLIVASYLLFMLDVALYQFDFSRALHFTVEMVAGTLGLLALWKVRGHILARPVG